MNILETERLQLCEFTFADAPFIFELVNDPDFIQYIGDRGVNTLDDARTYIAERLLASYHKNGFGFYCVKLKESDNSIGMCGLVKRDFLDDVDIGYAFLPDFRGEGFALEAAQGVMAYAKQTLGLSRIVAITDATNDRSIHLLQKLGLHLQGTIPYPGDDAVVNLFVPNA